MTNKMSSILQNENYKLKKFSILKWLFIVAVINFAIFVIITSIIGGDVLNGFVENGSYLVASHGKYTQVSEIAWKISRTHEQSLLITHPIGMLSALIH